jgi:hypothetical protein
LPPPPSPPPSPPPTPPPPSPPPVPPPPSPPLPCGAPTIRGLELKTTTTRWEAEVRCRQLFQLEYGHSADRGFLASDYNPNYHNAMIGAMLTSGFSNAWIAGGAADFDSESRGGWAWGDTLSQFAGDPVEKWRGERGGAANRMAFNRWHIKWAGSHQLSNQQHCMTFHNLNNGQFGWVPDTCEHVAPQVDGMLCVFECEWPPKIGPSQPATLLPEDHCLNVEGERCDWFNGNTACGCSTWLAKHNSQTRCEQWCEVVPMQYSHQQLCTFAQCASCGFCPGGPG